MITMSEGLKNPDTRSLPEGWEQEYDHRRQRWFYKQTSVTPPRISYAHPYGALKPSVTTQPTTPILNIRGKSQTSPKTSEGPASPTSAQEFYKSWVTPSSPASPATSPHTPNLPAHMRRMLAASDVLPTPTSPAQGDRKFPNRRVTLPAHAPSSPTIETSQPGGIRSFFTEMRLPDLPPPIPETSSGRSPMLPSPPLTPNRRMSTSDVPTAQPPTPVPVRHLIQRQSVSVSNPDVPFTASPSPPEQTLPGNNDRALPSHSQHGQSMSQSTTSDPAPQLSFGGLPPQTETNQRQRRPVSDAPVYMTSLPQTQIQPQINLALPPQQPAAHPVPHRADTPQQFHGYLVTWYEPAESSSSSSPSLVGAPTPRNRTAYDSAAERRITL